jgi:outer membrane lipoprotein LolB
MAGIIFLSACSAVPSRVQDDPQAKQAYQLRLKQLRMIDHWSLEGRLAISDGKDGGSGKLNWQQQSVYTRLSFRGAMGKGAWELHSGPGEAQIELANGEVHFAASLAELIENQVGWKVPVGDLSWWVKGLASPGQPDSSSLDAYGQLLTLSQSGWQVEFAGYREISGTSVPSKLTARRGKYLVKMVIKVWELGAEAS